MRDSDSLTRCLLYPRAFPEGVLAPEAFVRLDRNKDSKDEVYETSVGPRGRFANETQVHEFGCRVSVEANERGAGAAARNGKAYDPACYIGYYTIRYGELLRITADYYHISVVWSPADGLKEHCDLTVRWNGYPSSANERKTERLQIQIDIAALLEGPVRGLCACDAARHSELASIIIPNRKVAVA